MFKLYMKQRIQIYVSSTVESHCENIRRTSYIIYVKYENSKSTNLY